MHGLPNVSAAERGLICAFWLRPVDAPVEVTETDQSDLRIREEGVTWLHFNLGDVRAKRWLTEASFVPQSFAEALNEKDAGRQIELADDGLLMVINDFTYDAESDPSDVAPLWCFANRHMLVTARLHALKSTDVLRSR